MAAQQRRPEVKETPVDAEPSRVPGTPVQHLFREREKELGSSGSTTLQPKNCLVQIQAWEASGWAPRERVVASIESLNP